MKKRVTPSCVSTAAVANTTRKTRDYHDYREKLFFSLCCAEEGPKKVSFCLSVRN
jgi:hypothetical protein